MAKFRLIPREEKFYDDFISLADQVRVGALLLAEMFAGEKPIAAKALEIKEVEHKCDFMTHEIIQRLNKTFVTPIDREDIHSLATRIDDVMDAIDMAAGLVPLYRIDRTRFGALELTKLIIEQVGVLRLALVALEKRTGVLDRSVEIKRLENEADKIYKDALGRLFDEERDPIMIIKWKEILSLLEQATDRCEDVGNLLENVIVKLG
jgi:predicted phosphate transport protein (TIGR00153 family)